MANLFRALTLTRPQALSHTPPRNTADASTALKSIAAAQWANSRDPGLQLFAQLKFILKTALPHHHGDLNTSPVTASSPSRRLFSLDPRLLRSSVAERLHWVNLHALSMLSILGHRLPW